MEVQRRALLIAFIGPAMQAFGLSWLIVHMLVIHWSGSFTARHLMYEPGALLAVAGFIVTMVCVPLAIEVARASEAELAIPVYEPDPSEPSPRTHHHAHPHTH